MDTYLFQSILLKGGKAELYLFLETLIKGVSFNIYNSVDQPELFFSFVEYNHNKIEHLND